MSEHSYPRFWQARSKLEWAKKHIGESQGFWERYLRSQFHRIVTETHPGGVRSFICQTEPLPAEILLAAGDAIHNMRSALDYTINEIMGHSSKRLGFPMHGTKQELIDSFRTKPVSVGAKTKGVHPHAAIEIAAPGIGKLIVDKIGTYDGGNGPLWSLNRLDNRDKHRLIIAAAVPNEITGISLVSKKHPNFRMSANAGVNAGNVVRLATFGGGIDDVEVQDHGKATAEIFIEETGVIVREPLFPTLINFHKATAKAIDTIDQFLIDTGWSAPVAKA